jgi:hypothetical protein
MESSSGISAVWALEVVLDFGRACDFVLGCGGDVGFDRTWDLPLSGTGEVGLD